MKRILIFQILLLAATFHTALAINPPTGLVIISGDKSVILHWNPNTDPNLAGYNVYRSLSSGGPFVKKNTSVLTSLGYCDLTVSDGTTYYYQITATNTLSQNSLPSVTLSTVPNTFSNSNAFLDYLQQANFDYFWYAANPANGLVPDRSRRPARPAASQRWGLG